MPIARICSFGLVLSAVPVQLTVVRPGDHPKRLLAIVGAHLEGVGAGIDRHLLGEGVHRTASLRLGGDGGRDAVDAPLDAPHALAAVLDAGTDRYEVGG